MHNFYEYATQILSSLADDVDLLNARRRQTVAFVMCS